MEGSLLTRERMEQILEARSDEDAAKLLHECGYPELDASRPEAMDAALSAAREAVLEDLAGGAPDPRYIDLFKLKYDYHNVKALLKAAAVGADPSHMLMDMGRVSTAVLREALETGHLEELPDLLAQAVEEAREVLDTTRDPQLSDIVLDRWTYREMTQLAGDTGSAFLLGYVRTQIDAANLRTLIRVAGWARAASFCGVCCFPAGKCPPRAWKRPVLPERPGLRSSMPPPGSRRRQKPAPRPCRAVP